MDLLLAIYAQKLRYFVCFNSQIYFPFNSYNFFFFLIISLDFKHWYLYHNFLYCLKNFACNLRHSFHCHDGSLFFLISMYFMDTHS